MDNYRRRKPTAIAVAESLLRQRGEGAFELATCRQSAAVSAGRTARADLYRGVCTILGDRDLVFTRLKRPPSPA